MLYSQTKGTICSLLLPTSTREDIFRGPGLLQVPMDYRTMSETQVQDYVAKYYEQRYSGNGLLYHQDLTDNLMQSVYGKVLDVGCGTGFLMEYRSDQKIEGIDISEEMIKLNPLKDKCKVGDVHKLASYYPKETFDFVICRGLLHHMKDPKRALAQMRVVLKTGGKIALLETNSSIINRLPRKLLKKTKRFSEDHQNFEFEHLENMVLKEFLINDIKFVGFVAYPLIGFPDFFKLPVPTFMAEKLIEFDNFLSNTFFRKLAFNVIIRGEKYEKEIHKSPNEADYQRMIKGEKT